MDFKLNLFLMILSFLHLSEFLPLPYNQYAYMEARNRLAIQKVLLNSKENFINFFMEKLKYDEFKNTSRYFLPAHPIELEYEKIINRDIYKFLYKLPKGGNLHIHEFQMLNRRTFLEFVLKQEPESDWVYICDLDNSPDCKPDKTQCKCLNYQLKYFPINPEKGFVKVKNSNWTIDKIVQKTTLVGILNGLEEKIYPTDTSGRWKVANDAGVFGFYDNLSKYNKTRFEYMKATLDSSLNENVQYIEFRRSGFGSTFAFDKDFKQFNIPATDELDMLIRFKEDYIKQNPNLIDFVFVIYGSRSLPSSSIDTVLKNSMILQAKYPNMIRGFDLVGEEDQGHTLLFHSDTLMTGFNYSQTSNGTFNLLFHTAETNWPQDIEPAKYGDGVSTLDNLYDAIILKTNRVGHGIGLIKKPELYKYFIDRKIVIEACPASNQILGYVSDLRNHPAINYFKSGIPVVLSGDDPGSFGYNDLTVDFYLAYMAWGLDLYDLKILANNSIRYSSMPDEIKQVGYEKFNKLWNSFIDENYQSICLSRANAIVNVSRIMPSYGPSNTEVLLTLYGNTFERALCENVSCLFNNFETGAEMVSIDEIRCYTPKNYVVLQTKSVEVKLKIGSNIYPTNLNYTFVTTPLAIIEDETTTLIPNSENSNKFALWKLFPCILAFSFFNNYLLFIFV